MPNMFKSTLASSGGGDGADLIVTCAPNFAGSVITCTDGSAYTKTQTCPSSSPYEVTFESIPPGTYTISGVVSGQTFSTTKTILDFDASLTDIPDGSTITPTDDIQIWLNCANIWDKTYTSISEVLSDASTLQTLISDNNAADYMARSTTWASDVAADSSAMSYIGLNDYCSDVLLANATWCTSICNSTFFESVLNIKVPTMTSNTTPSGVASSYRQTSAHPSYRAFDNQTNTYYSNGGARVTNDYLQYEFPTKTRVYKVVITYAAGTSGAGYDIGVVNIRGSDDDATFVDYSTVDMKLKQIETINISSPSAFKKWRIQCAQNASSNYLQIGELQFYGRA